MSAPTGPVRPPTDDPKTNVLLFGVMGCVVAAFCFVVLGEGAWRWLAVVPVVLGVWLFARILRRAREHDVGMQP